MNDRIHIMPDRPDLAFPCVLRRIRRQRTAVDRWLMYFALASGGLSMEKMFSENCEMLKAIGVLGDDNEINLDALERFGKIAFEKQPKVKLWKITFSADDFALFMAHLRGGSKES